jgi:hypothetical protein
MESVPLGCGLGPGPDPAGEHATTGTAPWADLGPAKVCLGTEGLAPPASPPGGLCIPAAAPAATPCLSDASCGSREACVCGACVVPYCASATDCEAPRTCNFSQHRCDLPCTTGTICGDVAECIAGVCRGRCATTQDCQHGEFCDSNHVCFSDDCSATGDCLGLERCEIQRVPRQVLEPAPVARDGTIVLYLDLAAPATADQRAIWRAVSSDGLHFKVEPSHAVLEDPLSVRAPSVVVDGPTTYLYFEYGDGRELRVATSIDGQVFGTPMTILDGPGVHAPTAVHIGGRVVLYYERGGAIGLATGSPESRLDDQGIVLGPIDAQVGDGTPGSAFWTPITQLASPHAIVSGPGGATSIHLWFAGFGTESSPAQKFGQTTPIPPNFSIGFAAADPADPASLRVWPYGPVADRVEAFLDHRDELGPAGVAEGNRFRLYYVEASHETGPPFTLGRLGVLGSGR